jgi:hypothetical protein
LLYGCAQVDTQQPGGLFWDEAFAWAPPAGGGQGAQPAPNVDPEPLVATPVSRASRYDRHIAHSSVARHRRRARLYPLAGVLAVLAIALAVVIPRGGKPLESSAGEASSLAATPASPPPAALASAVETANMRIGDDGEAVRALQYALVAAGFDVGAADGGFEAKTRDGVAAFQQSAGLTADGVVGPETAGALVARLVQLAEQDAAVARAGLIEAGDSGRLSPEAASRYLGALDDAVTTFEGLTLARAANLEMVLDDVAAHADAYSKQRALALFSMLETNAAYFAGHDPPAKSIDIVGEDSVVYRFFRSRGFQFHPIANFAALNKLVGQEKSDEAHRLGQALAERGVPAGKGLVWEYYFPFGGPARWTSGFAQSVAADSLSRAGKLAGDDALVAAARRAFLAIPRTLARPLGGGMWIREYGFSDIAILNAQLQSLISLSRYADVAGDAEAQAFAAEMDTATRNLLPSFNHGACWSLYSLDGNPAPEPYQRYHISLLKLLAESTGAAIWADTARRWKTAC